MTNKTKWSIDHAHSEISFKVRHLMIAHVKGTFTTFDAIIYTTRKDFTTAQIDLWIDASSINTADEKRDKHLKGPDFFDVKNYEQIRFTSTSIKRSETEEDYELRGTLTIKEISNEVLLNAEYGGISIDPQGNEKAGFTITGKINKIAWGLGWNKPLTSGGLMLSEEVAILCDVELTNEGQQELTMEDEEAAIDKKNVLVND